MRYNGYMLSRTVMVILLFLSTNSLFSQENDSIDGYYTHIFRLNIKSVKESKWVVSSGTYEKRTLTVDFTVDEILKGKIKFDKENDSVDLVQYRRRSLRGGSMPTVWSSLSIKTGKSFLVFSKSKETLANTIISNPEKAEVLKEKGNIAISDLKFVLKNKKNKLEKQISNLVEHLKETKKTHGFYLVEHLYALLQSKKNKKRSSLVGFVLDTKSKTFDPSSRRTLLSKMHRHVKFDDKPIKELVDLFVAHSFKVLIGNWEEGTAIKKINKLEGDVICHNLPYISDLKNRNKLIKKNVTDADVKLLTEKMKLIMKTVKLFEDQKKNVEEFIKVLEEATKK